MIVLKSLLLAGLLLGLIVLLGSVVRPQLEGVARLFVARFGVLGMSVGTYLADAFSFPVPPQFYLLAVIAGRGRDPILPLVAISVGSVLGGHTGYRLARPLSSHRLLHRLRHRSQARVDALFARYGIWAIAVGSISPIPFSVLCWAAGVYRVSYPLFSLFTLLRVPRILFFYYLIKLGWR